MNSKNLLLKVQYDGTRFHGYQIQPEALTVQKVIEDALFDITGEVISINGCSRTDARVHAVEYACSFVTVSPIPAERFPIVLNSKLPDDVWAMSCTQVPMEFHARFDTQSKTYRYVINTKSQPDVFFRNYEWQLKKDLNIDSMREASQYLIGENDFSSFMTSGTQVASAVRTVYSIQIMQNESTVEIYISANGYLYNMVRIIVGTLVDIGLGRYNPAKMKEILLAKNRQEAGPTAPPQGLSLFKVVYREEFF